MGQTISTVAGKVNNGITNTGNAISDRVNGGIMYYTVMRPILTGSTSTGSSGTSAGVIQTIVDVSSTVASKTINAAKKGVLERRNSLHHLYNSVL